MKSAGKEQNNPVIKLLKEKEAPVFLIIVVLMCILSVLSPHFLTRRNLMTTLVGLSGDGIIVIGMTVILAMGGIDLSVGSVMGLAAMITARLFIFGMNPWLAALAALAAAALCGAINGVFISKLKLSPFIMTLAMMSIAKGITLVTTEGKSQNIPRGDLAFLYLGQGFLFNVFPVIVAIFLLIAVVGNILLRKTEVFRKVYYIGSNEKSAKLSGIDTDKIKIIMYILCSSLAGLSGVLSVSRFASSTPQAGTGVEMTAISAAVIGGSSLSGGRGTVLGAVLGIILLNIVNNGLILLRISVYSQDLILGLILLAAVTFDILSQRRTQ